MSNEQHGTALPPVDTAAAVVLNNVQLPPFLEKLAQYGIVPETQEDLDELLKMASTVRQVDESQPSAASRPSLIKRASQALASAMTECQAAPVVQTVALRQKEARLRELAMAVLQRPEIYNSELALKQAEVAQHQQYLLQHAGQ